MIIKYSNRTGKRTICTCKNCGEEFSQLDIKLREGGGKFCSVDCRKEYKTKNAKDPKKQNRLYQKKNKYGLTQEQYEALFEEQDNKCAICNRDLDTVKACVDHNHTTGVVRGILCSQCNSILGFSYENIETLKNAI